MDYVAGYTVAHDVSARDWQLKKNGGQWLLGKTFDSFCPLGPAIVTKDSLPSQPCPLVNALCLPIDLPNLVITAAFFGPPDKKLPYIFL